MKSKKTKFRSYALVALMILFALVLSLAFGSLGSVQVARAADYRPTSLFSAGTGGTIVTSGDDDGSTKYVKFELDEGGKVYYRRDLALKWYSPSSGEGENNVGVSNLGQVNYLSLEIQLSELNYKHFSIAFESAEENISKDETSRNTVHFYKTDEGVLSAAVQDASHREDDWEAEDFTPVGLTNNTIALTLSEEECDIGEFQVLINGTEIGKITNVGGYYMEYLSSASSTPRIPITFMADDLQSEEEKLGVLVKKLNGQSFEVNADGRVVDNAPAALVVNERVHAYMLGKSWSLTYEAIDVCDDSVTVTRKYAMAKTQDGTYVKLQDEDYESLTTSTYFVPTGDQSENEEEYVSIYFSLDDGTELSDEEKAKNYIYLSWYAEDNAVQSCGEGDNAFDYIKVNRKQGGPSYVGLTVDENSHENVKSEEAAQLAEEYQAAVDEASKDLSAGKGSYFYLPSLRGMIASEYADYRNLRFSIYYRKQSDEVDAAASSATALRYNGLRFEITEEGKFVFKVVAEDALGNGMQYYYEDKLQKVTADNLWEIEEIPTFHFEASYSGATVEKPGSQALGYSGQSYTFTDFTIVGLEGYQKKYTLYRLNVEEAAKEFSIPGYSTLADDPATYFNRFKDYMTVIRPYNENVKEEDEERWNSTFNAYEWKPDEALSFVPQQKAYYFLKVEVTESRLPGHSEVAYQVIDVQNSVDQLPETPDWLQNNITSVVLFSISAALLIVVIIIFVAKPSEKTVEEIDLESLKGKSKGKNKKDEE